MIKNILEALAVSGYNFLFERGSYLLQNLRKPKVSSRSLFLGYGSSPLLPSSHQAITISSIDRRKGTYIIGATGSGKSKYLESLVRQDILKGNGFGVLDPHGDLVNSILGCLAEMLDGRDDNKSNNGRGRCSQQEIARQALRRLILVDLSNGDYSIGFNPLEVNEKDLAYQLILELVEVFKKIWEESWGPSPTFRIMA